MSYFQKYDQDAKKLRKKLIHEALQKRLSKTNNVLSQLTHEGAKNPPVDFCENCEECLKIVMVKLYPKLKSGNFTTKVKEQYFSLLLKLVKKALSDDFRFLDAFNNAYETILQIKWSQQEQIKYLIPFFETYKFLLSSHSKKLKGL